MNATLPSNYNILFAFEKNFNKLEYKAWMTKYSSISIYIGIIYVFLIFKGKQYMKSKPPFELRKLLVLWSCCLSIFSLMGAIRTIPELVNVFGHGGVHEAVCSRAYAEDNQVTGMWGWLFSISKGPELLDTAFIILRKQNLMFLHWYHHLVTLIYTWHVYPDHPSIARTHIIMNYVVHAVMYFYFVLRALKIRTPRIFAMFITASQIIQLILGTCIAVYALGLKLTGRECGVSISTVLASTAIYFTLALLFVKFFYYNYYLKKNKKHCKR